MPLQMQRYVCISLALSVRPRGLGVEGFKDGKAADGAWGKETTMHGRVVHGPAATWEGK